MGENLFVVAKILISKCAAYNIGYICKCTAAIYTKRSFQPRFCTPNQKSWKHLLNAQKYLNDIKTQQLANFANFRATYQKEKICVAHFF